jgi:glycosyltransferase involved in cell wall biosynthesis
MKILWVNSDFLHPTTRGGQIRTLETLKRLHQRHEIHYAALHLPSARGSLERSAEYCTKAYPVAHHVPRDFTPRFYRQVCESHFSKTPLAVLRYRSNALRQHVDKLTRKEQFDAIVCDFLFSAANIPDPGAAILFQHNVESIIWKRQAEHARTRLLKLYFQGQYERMLRYEERVCRSVKRIVAVSGADARAMQSLYGVAGVAAVPTGVDLNYFAPRGPAQPATDLVFLGSMDWRPNIDGIRWFAADILPLIRRRRPECSLTVAGRRPSTEILRLAEADARIHVTGTVPDVRPYLWESAVSIVPLRIGGGTRLKIYEAMAARIPVVSTTVGAEGLDVRDGENIALADSPDTFADRCLALLGCAEARRKQSQAAWEMVSTCYSWEAVSRKFELLLADSHPHDPHQLDPPA